MRRILTLILLLSIILLSCENSVESVNIKDNNLLYDSTENIELHELQLTIFKPENNTLAEGLYTFEELNQGDGKVLGSSKDIEVSGLLKEVESGKSRPGLLGYGLTEPNAVVEQRGRSARLDNKKSYLIDLLKSGGLFNGHEILNLNKHASDPTRIYNKLSFDLFAKSNEILSLQTDFINLWIKDLNKENLGFVDYGLFTLVEDVNENYFERRNLDENGHLYKAEIFEFREYSGAIKLESDPNYSKSDFEFRLGISGLEEHAKLIKMLEAVNNQFIQINDVIDTHFNRDNYLTWLASNILLGNIDSASGNFYLYSPKASQSWYFIPWDYDGSFRDYGSETTWREGISNYWGSILHQRFLKNDDNREALTKRVDDLYKEVYNVKNITELVDAYEPILIKSFSKEPDKKTKEEINLILEELHQTREKIWENKMAYYETLEKPMPFYLGSVVNQGEYITINWGEAYDFQGQEIKYELLISDEPAMTNVIYHKEEIKDTEYILENLPSGRYYFKVIAKDSEGLTQGAFDIYVDQKKGLNYFGVKTFYIE